jgi:hypothetical protein
MEVRVAFNSNVHLKARRQKAGARPPKLGRDSRTTEFVFTRRGTYWYLTDRTLFFSTF